MADEEVQWRDERHGFRMDGSLTELYAATANTLDRILQEVRQGGLAAKPLRALVFVVLDPDGNVALFQAGGVQEIIYLATQAAEQAVKVAQQYGEAHDEE